jgi:hypothetical protein
VTDLGTEFGVEVGASGDCAAYVFQGEIELRTPPDGSAAETVRLVKDESAYVERDAGGRVAVVDHGGATPNSFVRHEQLGRLVQERQAKLSRDRATRYEQLLCDPSLVVCYDFRRQENEPNVLRATGRDVGQTLDGVIENATWTTGRLPGKEALLFDGHQSRVKVDLPEPMTHMTLAAWLTVGLIDGNAAGLLTSNQWDSPGKCCWQINRSGEILLRLCSASGVQSYWTTPLFSWQQLRLDKWRHLAVALDSSRPCVAFYVDGRKVREERLRQPLTIAFGNAQIGNAAATQQAGQFGYGFHGRMGELSVFARALSDQDVKDLYEAGKP